MPLCPTNRDGDEMMTFRLYVPRGFPPLWAKSVVPAKRLKLHAEDSPSLATSLAARRRVVQAFFIILYQSVAPRWSPGGSEENGGIGERSRQSHAARGS